jgi:catechol 2,3-dioxygenase
MTNAHKDCRALDIAFSHMGISVLSMKEMREFYTGVLGFFVTDEGFVGSMEVTFLSRDPTEHHQIVLATGRPRDMAGNTLNPAFGPSINQISFRVRSLDDMRAINRRLEQAGVREFFAANHGNAWSTYAKDPEGNTIEFFIDTDWYVPQPCLQPLDLSKSDEEIYQTTKSMCEGMDGCMPMREWRAQMRVKMNVRVK